MFIQCAARSNMKFVSAMLACLALMASPAAAHEEDVAQKLNRCGEGWNKKLQEYEARLPKLQQFLAYYRKWESYPAQRPPRSAEPLLTRADYRACMYACLEERPAACPGGWPAADEKK
jgi:hypothetical protein